MRESTREISESNRFGWNYLAAAQELPRLDFPIWDVHSHLSGAKSVGVLTRVMEAFGVERIYSMSPLEELDALRDVLGDRVRFIATPDFRAPRSTVGPIQRLCPASAAICVSGCQNRKILVRTARCDFAEQAGAARNSFHLDTPHVRSNIALAVELGMHIMVHIGDPDTWFKTHYADEGRYGSKLSQYESLEACLEQFPVPFIAAHLGGWPENLEFLSLLLERHRQLYLDTSTTKWMVRELSRGTGGRPTSVF